MTKLFLRVEAVENLLDSAKAISQAIIALSKNEPAVEVLLHAFAADSIQVETMWREIEQMPEFKAKYTDRDTCRADFFKAYLKR